MDASTVELAGSKRRPHNKLGWSVQWGTVRMLGTFLSEPAGVPDVVAEFMAEQVGVDDPACLKMYPDRLPTKDEHAREIRELLGYKDFAVKEMELRSFVASRVWSSVESRRALFDRAVVWLMRHRVLLPGDHGAGAAGGGGAIGRVRPDPRHDRQRPGRRAAHGLGRAA
jgi:hypothetical protein